MSQLRRDPITGRWIIVDITRTRKLEDFDLGPQVKKGGSCPFCPGSEHETPPEIERIDGDRTWAVRVVPNKFPALALEGDLDKHGVGMFDTTSGVGAHEVIIENPDHRLDTADLSQKEMEHVLMVYRSRSLALEKDPRFRYILIFKNHGASAGASLEHSHSQLVALPIVPKRVREELKGAYNYFDYKERCVFCDMIAQEVAERKRVVLENDSFLSFTPFVPRFAFETWILPKDHNPHFKSIDNKEIVDLAYILKDTLMRIKKLLKDPPYNFIIHTAPIRDGVSEEFHWHLEIMPKLTSVAGFEWGSGFYINPTSPELAAKCLRKIAEPMRKIPHKFRVKFNISSAINM